ncbi:MAG: hypothetical protein KDI16_09945 [Halioglobus sp.]|nr:hypothetical protein [Halioglobus sp.]
MKRINREISIFNLSMMDVISGAMGAFLILVVILSRHYNSEFINTQRILDLQKQLVEATGSLSEVSELVSGDISNTDLIERSLQAAKSNVDRSKAYVKEIYDELQEANATIEQQTEQIAALESRLVRFKPFFIMTKWSCDEATDIDIYLWNNAKSDGRDGRPGQPMPAFDPDKVQNKFFAEELEQGLRNTEVGLEVWTSSLSDIDSEHKLYYRINRQDSPLSNCAVESWLVTPDGTTGIERQRLSPQQPWIYVGSLAVDDERVVTFRKATEDERAAEHAEVRAR